MLIYPSVDEIKKKADSRYTLVITTAKRARDLVAGKPALVEVHDNVPISIAAEEIMNDEIGYRRPNADVSEVAESDSEELSV